MGNFIGFWQATPTLPKEEADEISKDTGSKLIFKGAVTIFPIPETSLGEGCVGGGGGVLRIILTRYGRFIIFLNF